MVEIKFKPYRVLQSQVGKNPMLTEVIVENIMSFGFGYSFYRMDGNAGRKIHDIFSSIMHSSYAVCRSIKIFGVKIPIRTRGRRGPGLIIDHTVEPSLVRHIKWDRYIELYHPGPRGTMASLRIAMVNSINGK